MDASIVGNIWRVILHISVVKTQYLRGIKCIPTKKHQEMLCMGCALKTVEKLSVKFMDTLQTRGTPHCRSSRSGTMA